MNKIVNPSELTQKDLMLHLLQVAQHTVTREELKEDINKLETKIDKLDTKIDSVEIKLEMKIDKLDTKIDSLENKVGIRIDKLEGKFDRLQWFIIAGALGIVFKEQILKLFI